MAQATKENLLRLMVEHQREIKQFGAKRCDLSGSYARDQHTSMSDIGILVEKETTRLSLGSSIEPRVDSDIQSETTLEPLFRILIHNNVNAENL
jgi:predicted nucleotidyltransferase